MNTKLPTAPPLTSRFSCLCHEINIFLDTLPTPSSAIAPKTFISFFTAFTLAEVLIVLGIIGLIADMTIPTLISSTQESVAVAKVKKYYSTISQAVLMWETEENCMGDSAQCLQNYTTYDCDNAFKGIEKRLNIVDRVYRTESRANTTWLPDKTKRLDGSDITGAWQGVSKLDPTYPYMCHYLLADGATMSVHMPDCKKQDAYILIDVNGMKKPNRVGKDVFPIGIGSYLNKYKTVNPYYAEDVVPTGDGGLCSTRSGTECNSDDGHSPTAYVLTHGKLPDLTKLGYPK